MVQLSNTLVYDNDQRVNTAQWLTHIKKKHAYIDSTRLIDVITLVEITAEGHACPNGQSCLTQGLNMAEMLAELQVDHDTLIAAISYNAVQYANLPLEDIAEQFGNHVAKLIKGVRRMDMLRDICGSLSHPEHHPKLDNIRKMLLAIVDDVRIVLIKLAERLCVLKQTGLLTDSEKQQLATETMNIYAPLANRLGIGDLKWQLQDLSFYASNPEGYKRIAKNLNERLIDREKFVDSMLTTLKQIATELDIQAFECSGRAKHIYSIHCKMMKKQVDFSEIYDAYAVRILVNSIEECYQLLSEIHNRWNLIEEEFDDYISTPKANGYQSIHTAVSGSKKRNIEIQIRTYQMHEKAELGVAAHWVYKEAGGSNKDNYDAKIAWLRQVMDWQKEMSQDQLEGDNLHQKIFSDRVYVFTPTGDVIDLPAQATPLDLAYQIHSDIGHRCRGAKVHGKIVPLTYQLCTGDQVEILTTKHGEPSRDWVNIHLGYLNTSRARSKVLSWFKTQAKDQFLEDGKRLFEKEIKRAGAQNIDHLHIAKTLHYKTVDLMLVALARGDVKLPHLNQAITKEALPSSPPSLEHSRTIEPLDKKAPQPSSSISVDGTENILTHIAQCCMPIPGDKIMGYITQGRGVSVHKTECNEIMNTSHPEKLIPVEWPKNQMSHYSTKLIIEADNRPGVVRDLTALLSTKKVTLTGLNCHTKDDLAQINLSADIPSTLSLSKLLALIRSVKHIMEATQL